MSTHTIEVTMQTLTCRLGHVFTIPYWMSDLDSICPMCAKVREKELGQEINNLIKAHIWVIEIEIGGEWLPTVGVTLTRQYARSKVKRWAKDSLGWKYRVRKYERSEP